MVSVRVLCALSASEIRACATGRVPAVSRVGVEHLQQQVVQQDDVLLLHTGKVLHAFVTADKGGQDRRVGFKHTD